MDSYVIGAAITAITSVVTCVLGLRAGRKDADSPSIRSIREAQLNLLYSPMEKILKFDPEENTVQTIEKLRDIIARNYPIVPPAILNEFMRISSSANVSDESLIHLMELVSSFYNWTRKALSYPYDASAIKRKQTPTYERNSFLIYTLILVGVLFWMICVLLQIGLFNNGVLNTPEWFNQLYTSVSVIGAPWVLVLYVITSKKR